MPCRQCRPLAGDRCQIAEPKPGSSGRMSCKLALSRAQRPPRLPLDARRAAPLPRPPRQRHRLSGSAQVPRACCRAGNHPGAGPSSRPGPCGHPQTDRRAIFSGDSPYSLAVQRRGSRPCRYAHEERTDAESQGMLGARQRERADRAGRGGGRQRWGSETSPRARSRRPPCTAPPRNTRPLSDGRQGRPWPWWCSQPHPG